MAKPTFLLFFGYGWAAGSPLCYTLQRLSKYCHLGFYKSASYIHSICNDPSSLVDGNLYKKIRKEQFSSLEDLTDYGRQAGHKLHLPVDRQPLKDFPIDLLLDMVYTPPSVEKYINYYKTLWNCVKPHGYKAVATFEELNPFSPNLSDFLQQLSQHFNLKGITILRDPIRRALSHYGSLMDAYQDEPIPKEFIPDVKNYLDNWLAQKQLVPDSQFFIMETLWDQGPKGDKERQKLSDFLDTPITDLWPNLYVPDKGHYLTWDLDKHFCPTPCQPPGQSLIEITPQLYKEYKKKYQHIYDQWQQYFGILPSNWGVPIDYTKNLDHDYNATMPYLVEKYNLDLGKHYNLPNP